ncbi:hypothetical protein J7F03_36075 [Streptomyces sp. ISL-43]|uniref:hypothetical protein n=1 Tax=Streptomyces sp. ISL-43 TaxID=2819183 RepID=UPI001BE5DEE4|nr:hypothetical protein [Streptomyces sp. ISL-43]MBT2452380.1 hypothetical protein [Streptomyces sp. ISL-43]
MIAGDNEIKLKAIAVLTGMRSGVGPEYVSSLCAEVTPSTFCVPVGAGPEEVARATLEQLSGPWSELVNGFMLAFEAVADAYDSEAGRQGAAQEVLQHVALELAAQRE